MSTDLHTRLACQTSLDLGHGAADLVAHCWLACSCHSLVAASGGGSMGTSTADASALRSQRALAGVAMVANSTRVSCGLSSCGGVASDRVG